MVHRQIQEVGYKKSGPRSQVQEIGDRNIGTKKSNPRNWSFVPDCCDYHLAAIRAAYSLARELQIVSELKACKRTNSEYSK